MRKLLGVAVILAVVVLPIFALADDPGAPAPQTPQTPPAVKPVVAGVVKSVTMDGDKLVSFILAKNPKHGGGEVTVTVDASTKYVKMPGKQAATAADIKEGVRVSARFKATVGEGAAVSVMIVPAGMGHGHHGGQGGQQPNP
jgi:hypothetical protein